MNTTDDLPVADYEQRDASPAGIFVTGALLLVGLAVVLAVCAGIYHAQAGDFRHAPDAASGFEHGPVERTGIAADWADQDRRVHEHLESYGWVDRPGGVVRIPLARAMELIAAESSAPHDGGKAP